MSNDNKKEQNNNGLDEQLKAKLNSSGWQKGLGWRQQTIFAVSEARKKGIREQEIFKQLKIAGLTTPTAKAIMEDAYYLKDEETSLKKMGQASINCAECGEPLKSDYDDFIEWHGLRFHDIAEYTAYRKRQEKKEDLPIG